MLIVPDLTTIAWKNTGGGGGGGIQGVLDLIFYIFRVSDLRFLNLLKLNYRSLIFMRDLRFSVAIVNFSNSKSCIFECKCTHIPYKTTYLSFSRGSQGVCLISGPCLWFIQGNCNISVADQVYFVKIVNHLSHFMIFY